jgi:hypothetical protein
VFLWLNRCTYRLFFLCLFHPTILWEQGDVFSCISTQHVAQENRPWPNKWLDVSSFMILPDVMGALRDCLPSSPFLNGMTQIPPTPNPHYCRIMWWLAFFPNQCKCEVQITCFWDGRWHSRQISRSLSTYPWWHRQLKNVQEENCCVPGEPDRYSTSAVSDQLYNHEHMNTINCTLRGNAFNWDMNAQW